MALELLSPAGSPEALRAAVQSGCGAVYLGWGDFNARRSAKNFTDEEFAAAIRYCHVRGVRVFLTLNTLLTDRELPLALEAARTACRLGVDSVLVQDWGLFDLLRQALPDLPPHASTQMSVFTGGGVRELYEDGCERVVIARECSKEDTASACKACPAEVEIFGHGALCMCYSGQCEFSALIGGRSGNRGTCAQPCRLPYGFNGPARNTYPLSLKDSCLAGRLAEMERMGVSCLKLGLWPFPAPALPRTTGRAAMAPPCSAPGRKIRRSLRSCSPPPGPGTKRTMPGRCPSISPAPARRGSLSP